MNFSQRGADVDPELSDVERLIVAFKSRPTLSVIAKLDLLLQFAWRDDPHIVLFLLAVVADRREPNEVRIDALKWLSDRPRMAAYHRPVADAIIRLLSDGTDVELRLQATLALAEFTDVDGVLSTLGHLVLDSMETIDMRYAAFTSIENGGPTPEGIALIRQLTADETFGDSARSLLIRWHLTL